MKKRNGFDALQYIQLLNWGLLFNYFQEQSLSELVHEPLRLDFIAFCKTMDILDHAHPHLSLQVVSWLPYFQNRKSK